LGYKDLAEKLNLISKEIHAVFFMKEIRDITTRINKSFASIFNALKSTLWIVDSMTGILYTFHDSIERVKKMLLLYFY